MSILKISAYVDGVSLMHVPCSDQGLNVQATVYMILIFQVKEEWMNSLILFKVTNNLNAMKIKSLYKVTVPLYHKPIFIISCNAFIP